MHSSVISEKTDVLKNSKSNVIFAKTKFNYSINRLMMSTVN